MINHLPSLHKLIRQLQRIPYLASKNLYKVAAHFLNSDQKIVEQLCTIILEAKKNVHHCSLCFNWAEGNNICFICTNPKRDKHTLCIVETWHDLCALETSGEYQGLYHVLGGVLCPLEGVGPDQLNIDPLIKRITNEPIHELIFATNATPEGEATSSLIWSKIKTKSLRISKLASGVPTGSSIEHIDCITLSKALLGRQPF